MAKLDGRKVVVNAGDFTVRGGSAGGGDRGAMGQDLSSTQRALEWRLPYVRLLDAAGGGDASFEHVLAAPTCPATATPGRSTTCN